MAGLTAVHIDGKEDLPPGDILAPAWYVVGFPKAGTHLVTAMLMPFARPMPATRASPNNWVNSFEYNGWTNRWQDVRKMLYVLCGCKPGYYYKGHCGYREEIERTLFYTGTAMVFVYRDLRDVAVSQAHHVLSDSENFRHQDKAAYRALGGFDEVLAAVIEGLHVEGEWGSVYYPGVCERWALYAPWLDAEWVHKVRYEQARADPEGTAAGIVQYGMARLAGIMEIPPPELPGHLLKEIAQAMVASAANTRNSPTFRKGQVGGWEEAFTKRHRKLFKKTDAENWLMRLGFERNRRW